MASVPRGRSVNPAADDDKPSESEWEWEYHETETESFYITLDLPAPPSRARSKATTTTKSDPKSKAPAADTNPSAHPTPRSGSAGIELSPVGADPVGVPASPSGKRIQILDFHSENPIVSYQNQYYSCQWTSTLGTDLLLASPNLDSRHPVLQREQGFEVLAATGIKIVGQPLQITARPEVRGKHRASPTLEASTERDQVDVEDNGQAESPGIAAAPFTLHGVVAPRGTQVQPDGSIRIPLRPEEGRARHSQARFLERLIAVKNAKGDPDLVPIYAKRKFTGSSWRGLQKGGDTVMDDGAVEQEHEEGDSDEEFDDPTQKDGPRAKKRARVGARGAGRGRAKGRPGRSEPVPNAQGSATEHQPKMNDVENVHTPAISESTPRTWDNVEIVKPPTDQERGSRGTI